MDPLVGERYRLLHHLGEGGTSVVWAAERVPDGAQVAVKIGRPGATARLEAEAAALKAVGGPHVVRVHGSGVAPDGRSWLAMERLVGLDLGSRIRQEGPLAPDALVLVLGPVADALARAHARGIVHRDLKPENVFLHREGGRTVVKLMDFGTDGVVGSPPYLAPEQARRSPVVTPAADVWAFGMTALAALTGDVYWSGSTRDELTASVLTQPMYAPRARWPWLPGGFDAWFLRACDRDPDARWPDVLAANDALLVALADASTPAPADVRLPVADTWSDEPARARIERLAVGRTVRLVGREPERALLAGWLVGDGRRLVTVLGPGGVGKTALAATVVADLRRAFTDGVCHVQLGAVRGDAVWAAIADALGPACAEGGSERDRVLRALAARRLLLCLDDAEQHLRTVGEVAARLLERCPDLALLVTSRVPLGLAEEQRLVLEPLATPADGDLSEVALAAPAVRLFAQLGAGASRGFRVTSDNLALVADIVRRVDGLPLALELAAARLRRHSLQGVVLELERSLSGLSGDGWRPERHQTLRAALHWSYELLPPDARRLYEELSVFVAGFDDEALAAVAGRPITEPLGVLADHNLVHPRGERWGVLETVRDYAAERLGARADRGRVVERWLEWAATLAERIEAAQDTVDEVIWLDRADVEHPNLRSALAVALELGDATRATRIAGALARFWYVRGHTLEGSAWIDRALQLVGPVPPALQAKASATAGRLALLRCEYARARRLCEAALATYRTLGDEAGALRASEVLGSVAREQGQTAAAVAIHAAVAAAAAPGSATWARASNYLAFAAWLGGDPAPAEDERPLEVFQALGDREGIVWAWLNRAAAALYCRQDLDRADDAAARALAEADGARFREGVAWATNLLGVVQLRRGAPATEPLRQSLREHAEPGDRWRAASVLEALSRALVDEPERAVRLLGAAEGLRARIEAPVPRVERPEYEASVAALAARLGPSFAPARAAGARLGLERAVALARRH